MFTRSTKYIFVLKCSYWVGIVKAAS